MTEEKNDAIAVRGAAPNLPAIELSTEEVKKYICAGASDKELALFMGICKSYALNPFKREIYFVKYGTSPAQTIVGYEVYLKRAERTGKLNGWDVAIVENNQRAKITIFRKDWEKPFIWFVDRAEFDKGQSTWKAMPNFMLKKVAIAQGMRLAFPDEIGGMPYIPEELPDNMSGGHVSENLGKPIDITPEKEDTDTPKEKVNKANEAAKKRTTKKTTKKKEPEKSAEEPAEEKSFEDPTGAKLTDEQIEKITGAFGKFDINVELLEKWRQLPSAEWTESVRKELLGLHKSVKAGDASKELLEEMTAEE
jgi:phage recombination protein Bet